MNSNLKNYSIGFILSLVLTLAAYFIVVDKAATGFVLVYIILGLAIVQMVVQLVYFLHLSGKSSGKRNLIFFLATVGMVFIIVAGSIWIMNHLNANMTPDQMNQYMKDQDGI